ncbi:radical SAM protein [Seleniivibrio woodruffii]|uniref:MoaA/NifB/PqqE/SkfB family radical SAM enzyme n=1 Tax=Seleniivibrio woodruffii TaxID=1078050 RepID=A0A4V2PS77_9BACT|nr:radical SAM protein [Seleniivibrio woodruffii]TCK61661.1 MoaA/NifB/PqqE/SkfB family radical SAM enzyme [Seleniivibrio woodruffii]TVZ35224.1 MoaA/NifB/PqqE/SkfB family radical SAM enzyme [Seleniivibrio woodruffii]
MALRYTKYKIFHFKDKLDSLPAGNPEIKPPVHIRIKPTNVCNHSCSYCAYRTDALQLGQDMNIRDFIPREKMLEIIDDCIEMGVKAVTFSGGGEPFCYKYFTEVLEKLAASPIQFASLSNGALVKGRPAEIFAEKGTWLRISIDGWDDESYSRYRSVKNGEFTNIMKNMSAFKAMGGKCSLGVSVIVDNQNCDHLYELVEKIRNTGADSVKISPCIVSNSAAENNRYHEHIFDTVKSHTERIKKDFLNGGFEIYDSYHLMESKFEKDYDWCPYLQVLPVIGADQNIYPCQDKAYNLEEALIGSIRDVRFKDFWFSGKNKFFKINPSKVCGHHCVANDKNKVILEYLNTDMEHLGFV